MKTYSLHLFFLLLFGISAQGQIKIGDNPQNIAPGSVLELESSTGALVITRMNTAQMNAIVPLQGALIYNTDSNCIHYYNGSLWLNLCNTINSNTFSSDSTITITETNTNYDFKVAEINGTHIKDYSITRDDISGTAINGGFHIQNRSITAIKMQAGLLNNVLQTQIAGNPAQPTAVWAPLNSNNIVGQNLEEGDSSITIEGGTGATLINARIRVSDNGITTEKIGTQGVIDANKILGTDANGDPEWQDAASAFNSMGADVISSDGSISGVMDNAALVGMNLGVNVDGTTIEIDPTNGLQIRDDAITSSKIANFQIGTPHLAFNAVNSDILLDASVTLSKLEDGNQVGQLMQWDGNAWIMIGESDLNIAITDADILETAAILGTKIAPNFGPQAVATTGSLTSGNTTVTGSLSIAGETTINSGSSSTTLPTDRGTANQVLTTDGAGAAKWATPTTTITGTSGSIFFASDDGSGTGPAIENNADLFWDASTDRLGLGTITPTHKLQVVGAIRGSALVNANGTASLPSYRFQDDLNSGMFRSAGPVGWLRFATNSMEAITIDPLQRVGIGTNTPKSTLHTEGSFATNIRSDNSYAVIIKDDDYTVIVGGAVTTIFLPAPSIDNMGRIYIIKNIKSTPTPITDYLDSYGGNATQVLQGVTQLQSDGTNWHQIN